MVHLNSRAIGFICRFELNESRVEESEAMVSGRVSLLAPFRNAAIEQEYRTLQLRYGTRIRVTTTLDRTGNLSQSRRLIAGRVPGPQRLRRHWSCEEPCFDHAAR